MRSATPSSRPTPRRLGRWRTAVIAVLGGIAAAALAVTGPAAAEESIVAESSIEVEATGCGDYDGLGSIRYVVRDPAPLYYDDVTITDASGTIVHEAAYLDGTEFDAVVPVEPGAYTLVYAAEGETNPRYREDVQVTVAACPDLDLAVVGTTCSTGADGAFVLALTGLVPGESYSWFMSEDSDQYVDAESGSFTAESATLELTFDGLAPGNPIVYVEWDGSGLMAEWRAVAIEPCQPEIALTLEQCTAIGANASAEVTASRLVEGVVYRITWPDGSTTEATGDDAGTASASSGPIEPGTSGSISIDGTWTVDDPYVEPPFLGGGPFIPIETVALHAEADYRAEPCPTTPPGAPRAPADAAPAVLPPTGTDSTTSLAIAGLLLSVGGVLMVLIRRRTGARD